ncbi:MAG: glycerophosphodiester phosphodiesterase [Pseudomonadota bacterium]
MKRAIAIICSALALFLSGVYLWPGPTPLAHIYFDTAPQDRAEIIAHGGGLGHAPPNTLIGLQRATDMGADVLEVDLQQTGDGVMILRHDDTLDRTTDRTGLIADFDWGSLATADAGARSVINGEHFAGQGIRIPTLHDALRAFPNARWIMEIKNNTPAAAEATCADIKGAGKEQKVLIASFHDESMAHFRTVCPNVATSMSSGEVRRFVIAARLGLTRFLRSPALALQIPAEADGIDLTHPRILAAAKARGIRVQYWTINEPSEMAALLEAGADGLMTDYVDRGFVALEARDD